MGNPFSIKEMDDWMKMIFHGQGKSWDLSEDVKEAQKEIPRSLVRYHRAMELYIKCHILSWSVGWVDVYDVKNDLSAAMSMANFLMRNCRFVESYQLAKWIFEYSLHRLKVRMGQEFFIYDPAVVSLLFDAAFCVGYSLMELNLMYAAYYYLEIASHSQDAEHIHEFINCLANTNDPQSLDVIEETLRNSPKPEDESYISAWNYHIAFLKRRKAYVLIERKMYVEAKQLLKEMIEEPLSRDFALNELRYLASMGF